VAFLAAAVFSWCHNIDPKLRRKSAVAFRYSPAGRDGHPPRPAPPPAPPAPVPAHIRTTENSTQRAVSPNQWHWFGAQCQLARPLSAAAAFHDGNPRGATATRRTRSEQHHAHVANSFTLTTGPSCPWPSRRFPDSPSRAQGTRRAIPAFPRARPNERARVRVQALARARWPLPQAEQRWSR
jgi:hypothetical protein